MREILFRGKRIDNGEWVYGDLVQLLGEQGKDRKFIVDNRFGACIDNKGNFVNTESPFVNEVYPETVGQYTGLKDMNGTEIYEGDRLRWESDFHDFIVEWVANETRFGVRNKLMSYCDPDKDSFSRTECCMVIGNIHD